MIPLHTYEQREAANQAWNETLAARGWSGYLVMVIGTTWRAEKIIEPEGTGVRIDANTQEDALAMIDRIER